MLQFAFFYALVPDKLEKLLPLLRNVYEVVEHVDANKLSLRGGKTAASLKFLPGIFIESDGGSIGSLVDELGAPVDVPEHWLPFLKLDFGVCTPSLALVEACLGSLARALPSTAPLSSLDAVRCWLSRGLDARAQDHR